MEKNNSAAIAILILLLALFLLVYLLLVNSEVRNSLLTGDFLRILK